MKIQELEQKTGLDRATIRFYEREKLIIPRRMENGYREYSEDDVNQLMKIKLLRQLDMSLEKIRQIQQGGADFSAELEAQVSRLSTQIAEHRRAKAVCQVIRQDGVDYKSLDGAYYLKLLQEMPVEHPALTAGKFQENVPQEIHPFRRAAAKYLDIWLFSALVQLLLYVILRIRPIPNGIASMLIQFAILFLFLPVEAVFLHLWGTTPGKWVMGIRLEAAEGGKLPWFHALCRGWEVLKYGMGFNLPIWSWFCAIKSYCTLTGRAFRRFVRYDEVNTPEEMEWDRDTEISYAKWEGKGKALLAGMICCLLILDGIVMMDSVRGRYRGDVTVAEFSANYNNFVKMLDQEDFLYDYRLQSDGTWKKDSNVYIHRDLTGVPEDPFAPFTYEIQDGYVRKISYKNKWTDVLFMTPLSEKCKNAAMATASAQDWFNLFTLYEFMRIWEHELSQPQGRIQYENIEIHWDMELLNCTLSSGYVIPEEDSSASSVELYFEILVHEPK